MERSLSNDADCKGMRDSTTSVLVPGKQKELSPRVGMKSSQAQGFVAPRLPSVTKMSLAELDSLMEPFSRRKTDAFSDQEIKLMIEEIGKVRHILLSKSRRNSRLMKEAWEEVARNMALHCPKRSAKQIKRKWRDIVSKTKKKLREGQLKQEMRFNEITALVTQFLASAGQEMQQREQAELNEEASPFVTQQPQLGTYYDHAGNSGNALSAQNMRTTSPDDGANTNAVTQVQLAHELSAREEEIDESSRLGVVTTTHSTHDGVDDGDDEADDSSDSDVVMIAQQSTNLLNSNGDSMNASFSLKDKALKKEFLRQSLAEHSLRMEILQLKRRYWQLKTDALLHGRQIFVVESGAQREWQ